MVHPGKARMGHHMTIQRPIKLNVTVTWENPVCQGQSPTNLTVHLGCATGLVTG